MIHIFLSLMLLLSGFDQNLQAEQPCPHETEMQNAQTDRDRDFDDCCNQATILKVLRLCAEKIKAKCLRARQAEMDLLCVAEGSFEELCVKQLAAESVSTNTVLAGNLCAQNANISNLCVDTLSTQTINFGAVCNGLRAYVGFAADTVYTLNTDVNYDTISEDPNGNVLSGPTSYTAPQTGWYLTTIGVNMGNIVASGPVFGTPIATVDLIVNGILRHRASLPFLPFSPSEDSISTDMVRLNAGDVVTVEYGILTQDPILGEVPLAGTVTLVGSPLTLSENFFSIIYLTSICNGVQPCNPPCPAFTPVACTATCHCSCD